MLYEWFGCFSKRTVHLRVSFIWHFLDHYPVFIVSQDGFIRLKKVLARLMGTRTLFLYPLLWPVRRRSILIATIILTHTTKDFLRIRFELSVQGLI